MSTGNDKIGRVMGPALFGAVTLLTAAGAVNMVAMLARSGPRVGDIIAFDRQHQTAALESEARLLVHRPDQYACVLDLNTMRQGGGSMVVEARMPGETRAFHLHWAGGRTSQDTADCGQTADLILDHRDMDILALAAGGYGVNHKSGSAFSTSVPF
jgi:hypothetical protein